MVTLTELLSYDLYSNYSCNWCGKNIILSEGIIAGEDDDAYLLCDYCSQYDNFDEVKESYQEEFNDELYGLYPKGISWL